MCHFLLPGRRAEMRLYRAGDQLNGRYADAAMALFEREASKRGTQLSEYQAKIFGGSNMLSNSTLRKDEQIGVKNTEAALMHLKNRDITLLVAHVGESGHRRIVFDVAQGDVWVKHSPLQRIILSGGSANLA